MEAMKNPNRIRYTKYILLQRMGWIFAALTVVVSIEYRTWFGVLWIALFLFFSWRCRIRAKMARCGLAGEEQTQSLLEGLPKGYTVLNNVELEVGGRRSEIDLLVVSESGLFVVEVKNHSGRIFGRKGQNTWRQDKRQETKYMKNPLHQLEREMRLLRQTLASFGVAAPIRGCVFFSNARAIDVDSGAVLTNGKALLARIQSFSEPVLRKSEIRKIVQILR